MRGSHKFNAKEVVQTDKAKITNRSDAGFRGNYEKMTTRKATHRTRHNAPLSEANMRKFGLRFFVAAAVVLLALVFEQSGVAQVAHLLSSVAPSAAASHSGQSQSNEAQIPASGETTVQPSRTFSGRIITENGELVLQNPVTKVSHKLSDPSKVKKHLGKQVKVTGKLDKNTNTIQIESVERLP
jgi:hypothetical protein